MRRRRYPAARRASPSAPLARAHPTRRARARCGWARRRRRAVKTLQRRRGVRAGRTAACPPDGTEAARAGRQSEGDAVARWASPGCAEHGGGEADGGGPC
eukprot:7344430-Prymnesium_polylepis.1